MQMKKSFLQNIQMPKNFHQNSIKVLEKIYILLIKKYNEDQKKKDKTNLSKLKVDFTGFIFTFEHIKNSRFDTKIGECLDSNGEKNDAVNQTHRRKAMHVSKSFILLQYSNDKFEQII